MIIVVSAIGALVVTVLGILVLRPLALAIKLVDQPGGRKRHLGKVPVVGGLAMFLGIVFGLGLIEAFHHLSGALFSAFALVVAVGLVDDRFSVSPWLRLPVQAAAALLLTIGTNTEISTLGDAFGVGAITLHGFTAKAITVLFVMTAINAFNMMDGMDGLAGTVAIVALTALAVCAGLGGERDVAVICVVLGAATAGFLLFNLPVRRNRRMRCFMGDAGSTLLGSALAWVCIRITQPASGGTLEPVTALWIVGLPVFEFFWTILRRLLHGRSPLRPDAGHFHHLLLRAGFGVRGSFMMFLVLTLTLAAAGLILNQLHVTDQVSLALLLAAGALMVWSVHHARHVLRFFPLSARRQSIWPTASARPHAKALPSSDA